VDVCNVLAAAAAAGAATSQLLHLLMLLLLLLLPYLTAVGAATPRMRCVHTCTLHTGQRGSAGTHSSSSSE
jgi:hypothetical protein